MANQNHTVGASRTMGMSRTTSMPRQALASILSENIDDSAHENTTLGTLPLLAMIPCVASVIGLSVFGWRPLSGGTEISLSQAVSTAAIAYVVFLFAALLFSEGLCWLTRRFGQDSGDALSPRQITNFAAYLIAPLFYAGAVALYPEPMVLAIVMALALMYVGYLILQAAPLLLNTEKNMGAYLCCLAVLGLALVSLVTALIFGFLL